jgi:hypothetical protein
VKSAGATTTGTDGTIDRYVSRDWHEREKEKIWKRTRAYPNACLHRARQLKEFDGWCSEIKCPFHGIT